MRSQERFIRRTGDLTGSLPQDPDCQVRASSRFLCLFPRLASGEAGWVSLAVGSRHMGKLIRDERSSQLARPESETDRGTVFGGPSGALPILARAGAGSTTAFAPGQRTAPVRIARSLPLESSPTRNGRSARSFWRTSVHSVCWRNSRCSALSWCG